MFYLLCSLRLRSGLSNISLDCSVFGLKTRAGLGSRVGARAIKINDENALNGFEKCKESKNEREERVPGRIPLKCVMAVKHEGPERT